MILNKTELRKQVRAFLDSKENFKKLKSVDQAFLVFAITEFADTAANKFIAGSVKHADSDFLTETDFHGELSNELRDAWMYQMGKQFKAAKRK